MPYKFLLHTMGRLSLTETKSFFHHFVKICCCCSVPKSCSALRNPMDCSMAGFLVLHYLPKFAQTPVELVMPPTHLILCHPLLLLLSTFPSIRVFSNESTLRMTWSKYWTFSLSISPSNEHPGLISFRMDWLDLLAVQGTLKTLLQHYSSTTGKTIDRPLLAK